MLDIKFFFPIIKVVYIPVGLNDISILVMADIKF